MDKIIKLIYGIFGIIITIISLGAIYDYFFTARYYQKLISGNTLKMYDGKYLRNKFSLQDEEVIEHIYGYGKNIEEGGLLLTNNRLINYHEGDTKETYQIIKYGEIKNITINNSKNITEDDLIVVESKNGFKISINVSKLQHIGDEVYTKIYNHKVKAKHNVQ